MINKPNLSFVHRVFVAVILFTAAIVYVSYFSDNPVIKSFELDIKFVALCLCIIASWGLFIYVNTEYIKNLSAVFEYGKASNLVSEDLRGKLLDLEKSYKDEVITKEEFRTKMLPYCVEIWKVYSKQSNDELSEVKKNKKAQIIDAYEKGILTEQEKNEKIGSL